MGSLTGLDTGSHIPDILKRSGRHCDAKSSGHGELKVPSVSLVLRVRLREQGVSFHAAESRVSVAR